MHPPVSSLVDATPANSLVRYPGSEKTHKSQGEAKWHEKGGKYYKGSVLSNCCNRINIGLTYTVSDLEAEDIAYRHAHNTHII